MSLAAALFTCWLAGKANNPSEEDKESTGEPTAAQDNDRKVDKARQVEQQLESKPPSKDNGGRPADNGKQGEPDKADPFDKVSVRFGNFCVE